MKRTFLVKKDPAIEAQDNWLIMDYRQYAAWRETDEGKNREIVFGKFEACSEDDSIIFMECNEKVRKELKKDCHRKQYIRSRDAETPFQVMSYSTMTFQESEIYGEDVLEDTECNVEESVMQRMDIERVRTALKMLAPEERAIIQDFFFTESPIPVKELVEKYAMPKTSIYSLWAAVLYGIGVSDDAIVAVALSQVGNIGGQPYWSWYGFSSRVEWCACFVSWCANECGYIDTGVIPKFAGCINGVQWFKDRGQWADNSIEPTPGMIIFFDWDNPGGSSGPQDGQADHVGIVEKCENGIVYTVEGNSGDSCRQRQYPVGYYEILGYGILCP